jgi:hypothetical protein
MNFQGVQQLTLEDFHQGIRWLFVFLLPVVIYGV